MEPIEVVHAEGQKDLTKEQKLYMKKQSLRLSMGEERFNKLYGEATGFFKANEKKIRRGKPLDGK